MCINPNQTRVSVSSSAPAHLRKIGGIGHFKLNEAELSTAWHRTFWGGLGASYFNPPNVVIVKR